MQKHVLLLTKWLKDSLVHYLGFPMVIEKKQGKLVLDACIW